MMRIAQLRWHFRYVPTLGYETEGKHDERFLSAILPVPNWTVETLYIHLSRIIADQSHRIDDHTLAVERTASAAVVSSERALQAALVSSEKAISKNEAATEKRFESVKLEADARHDALASKMDMAFAALAEKVNVNNLAVSRIESTGKGANQLWGYLVAGAGVLIALIGSAIGVITFFSRTR